MSNNDSDKVRDILKNKKASIRKAHLEPGTPSWDEILDQTWAIVKEKADAGIPGYKTIRKLLSDKRFDTSS